MSIYRKFMDSAKKGERQVVSCKGSPLKQRVSFQEVAFSDTNRQISLKFDNDYCSADNYSCTSQENHSNNKMQFVCSTVNSTPISKHQYKRLINTNENHYHPMPQLDRHKSQQSCLPDHDQHQHQHHHQRYLSQQQLRPQASQVQECPCCPAEPQQQQASPTTTRSLKLDSLFKTDDPIMLKWLRAMRFETELECLTALQARTLAIDEYSAGALSIRNSQVTIQEIRTESNFIIDFIDYLIECLPLNFNKLSKFSIEFSELWTRLMKQTQAQTRYTTTTTTTTAAQAQQTTLTSNNYNITQTNGNHNNLTIINCTPRKLLASARTLRPLDKLADQIRNICLEFANNLYAYQEHYNPQEHIDNGQFEASLRLVKELYGKFIEISIRAECANIVRALNYNFSQSSLNRLSSSSSLHPVRPFESSSSQLPLKWSLIALWQLTKDDSYICRTLTEKWQTSEPVSPCKSATSVGNQHRTPQGGAQTRPSRVAKRLDYSTKYDEDSSKQKPRSESLLSDYEKLYQICLQDEEFRRKQQQLNNNKKQGALSSALKSGQQRSIKQVSTIELLIDIIISQPNKHERLDMMNLIHSQARDSKLIDLEELDQSVSAAIYTSNQYKVAALRILNHLCVNEQAVKTILKCFYTPPANQDKDKYHYLIPENKIIRSIFECYQTAQEHIYQNETMFHPVQSRGRKRARGHTDTDQVDEFSDYGSRQTNSIGTSQADEQHDQSDDAVVKEALRLLIQLTTYFHRSNQGLDFYNLIGRISIDSLVKYLTNIIKSTTGREMLFLSLSALANISFITTEPMKIYGTNGIILEMFRASKGRSKDLELRDQAVTIMANTADKNLLDVVTNGGLAFLLSCLESCPTRMANYRQQLRDQKSNQVDSETPQDGGASEDRCQTVNMRQRTIDNKPRDRKPVDLHEDFLDDLDCACDQQQAASALSSGSFHQQMPSLCVSRLTGNELSALERIHQKTAVAFARISADPSTTKLVLNYGGIKQMIDLCKFSHKRNYSDTVLIACIAALRKIVKVVGLETFRHYNALDLIELELNHTLEIYGNPRHPYGHPKSIFASDV